MIAPLLRNQSDADASTSGASEKTWQVGTLTYTASGLTVLFFWLLWGDFAWSLKERAVPAVVQLLLKKFEASDLTAGLLIGSLPQAMAMIFSPIISYKSDNHRGKWGRRIPFLLIPTPVIVLSMVGLALSPQMGSELHRYLGVSSPGLNTSVLVVFGVFWALFEFATIAANSVFGGLINDVVPHSLMGRFYGLFRALSLMAGMLFNFWLLGQAEKIYKWIFIGIGAVYLLGFTLMCLKVREGEYPVKADEIPARDEPLSVIVKKYLQECFGHSYYFWVYAVVALSWMAFIPVNLFSVFFAKSISMDMGTYGKCIALTYLISLGLSYFLGALADRFHPLCMGLITLALYSVVALWAGIFVRDVATFAIALVGHGVVSGSWMTVTASLGQTLLPKAKFAQFFSAMGIVSSVGTMAVGPLVGWVLDLSHHQYRYTYFVGCGLSVCALCAGLVLYRRFNALGGVRNYLAPT